MVFLNAETIVTSSAPATHLAWLWNASRAITETILRPKHIFPTQKWGLDRKGGSSSSLQGIAIKRTYRERKTLSPRLDGKSTSWMSH